MAKKQPKFDGVINGIRVRIYATRTEYEAIFNDDDVTDMKAQCRVYPKLGDAEAWAHQARLEYEPEGTSA